METVRRRRFLAEPKVQRALIARVVFYWFFTVLGVAMFRYCFRLIGGPAAGSMSHLHQMITELGPSMVAATMLMPLVVLDVLRWSNRFAGPAFRINRTLRDLADGRRVEQVNLRDGDFWRETADAVNRIIDRQMTCPTDRPAD